MRRWSPLQSFLVGAIPMALVFAVVALAVAPEEPAPRPEIVDRSPESVGTRPLEQLITQALSREEAEPDESEIESTVEDHKDDLSWSDVATFALVDQFAQNATESDAGAAAPEVEDEVVEPEAEAEPVAEAEVEPEPVVSVAETGPTCGPVTCPAGFSCCNASCGICARPGDKCSQSVCGMPMTPSSVGCGPTTCNVGEICCDPACGKCISPGQQCEPEPCLSPIVIPHSESCGMTTCNTGFVCCNPSCGICARPGEPCDQRPC